MKKTVFGAMSVCILSLLFMLNPIADSNFAVSEGAEYSLVTPASSAYPDDGVKLTDGVFGTLPDGAAGYYSSNAYVGFEKESLNADGNFVIILDLGQSYSTLADFTVGYLNEPEAGINAPQSVSFAVSDERNGTYTELGTIDTYMSQDGDMAGSYAMTFNTVGAAGRYVRVTVKPYVYTDTNGAEAVSKWTFIDEINVFATGAGQNNSSGGEGGAENNGNSIPQTGDDSLTVFAFVLLALSAVAMMVALFVNSKNDKEF